MKKHPHPLLAGLLLATLATPSLAGDYFLTLPQKSDLILRGQMSDREQRLYDVWIVPGYVQPARNVRTGWHNAGEDLTVYGKSGYYHRIGDSSAEVWRTGTDNILDKFVIQRTRQSWRENLGQAGQRTRQRVFGWWLAYPWAIFESTVSSAVRIGVGVPSGMVVAASAYTVVPTWYAVAPVLKSGANATIVGTAFPVVAAGWNTAVAPPLAIFGQQPAPQRADGFWMKQVEDPRLPALIAVVKDWKKDVDLSLPATAQDAELKAATASYQRQIDELRARIDALTVGMRLREQTARDNRRERWLTTAGQHKAELANALQAKGLSPALLTTWRDKITPALGDPLLSATDIDRVLDSISGVEAGANPAPQRDPGDKTDPLLRTLDLVGGS